MAKKPSKMATIIKNLPRWGGNDPAFNQKVEAVQAIIGKPLDPEHPVPSRAEFEERLDRVKSDLEYLNDFCIRQSGGKAQASLFLQAFIDVKTVKETLSQQESVTNVLEEAYNRVAEAQFTVEGINSLRLASGRGYRLQSEAYASVEDPDKFIEWAMKNDLKRSLSMNWQKMNSMTKELLEQGLPEPDGVKAFLKIKLVKLPDGKGDE